LPRLKTAVMNQTFLEIQKHDFNGFSSHKPFKIEHHLAGHPLLRVERLLELSAKLPANHIRHNFDNQAVASDYEWISKTDNSTLSKIPGIIQNIQSGKSWIVLKYLEQDPEYKELLSDCLQRVNDFSYPLEGDMSQKESFVFLTSPNQVTPFHLDPEHNFLLQIQGTKIVHIFDPSDRTIVSHENLEKYFSKRKEYSGNLNYDPAYENKVFMFKLAPGEGLYFPPLAPHWIQNGPEPSISYSVTFRTKQTKKRGSIYACNDALRNLGISPTPPGQKAWVDLLKFNFFRLWNRLLIQQKQTKE
jgi:hypothetical protein